MASDLPFTSENRSTTFGLEGQPYDESRAPRADFHSVLPEYFAVMGIPLVEGGIFEESWELVADPPVVVNERMARIVAPAGSALGRGVVLDWGGQLRTLRVVGVVGDVLDDGFDAVAEPIFYLPYGAAPNRGMSVVARIRGDAAGVMEGMRQAIARADPDVPAAEMRTLDALLAETVARPRAASWIGASLALLALLVASAGIYGVLSYAVQSRTREIGIRAALGADARKLVSMVLGHTAWLLGVGLALGLLGALGAGRALSGILFGVRPWDPPSLVLAAVLLADVRLVAAWLPARRAVRVDPKEALRSD